MAFVGLENFGNVFAPLAEADLKQAYADYQHQQQLSDLQFKQEQARQNLYKTHIQTGMMDPRIQNIPVDPLAAQLYQKRGAPLPSQMSPYEAFQTRDMAEKLLGAEAQGEKLAQQAALEAAKQQMQWNQFVEGQRQKERELQAMYGFKGQELGLKREEMAEEGKYRGAQLSQAKELKGAELEQQARLADEENKAREKLAKIQAEKDLAIARLRGSKGGSAQLRETPEQRLYREQINSLTKEISKLEAPLDLKGLYTARQKEEARQSYEAGLRLAEQKKAEKARYEAAFAGSKALQAAPITGASSSGAPVPVPGKVAPPRPAPSPSAPPKAAPAKQSAKLSGNFEQDYNNYLLLHKIANTPRTREYFKSIYPKKGK